MDCSNHWWLVDLESDLLRDVTKGQVSVLSWKLSIVLLLENLQSDPWACCALGMLG